VKGTVTLDGEPVPLGMVVIHGEGGTTVRTATIDDRGNFELGDSPQGKVTVTIDFPAANRKKIPPKGKAPPENDSLPEDRQGDTSKVQGQRQIGPRIYHQSGRKRN